MPLFFFVLLIGLLSPAATHAQTHWEETRGLWLSADLGITPFAKYRRYIDEPNAESNTALGGLASLSVHFANRGPFAFGAHLTPSLTTVNQSGMVGTATAVDLGPSLLARLPVGADELTLRVPFGMSVSGVNIRQDKSTRDVAGSRYTISNEPAVGVHAALLAGVTHWLGERLALRFETGPWIRSVVVDEFRASEPASGLSPTLDREEPNVQHLSFSWTLSVGLQWRVRS